MTLSKENIILCNGKSKTKDSLGIIMPYDCTRTAIIKVIYNDITGVEQNNCFCKMHFNSFRAWINRASRTLQNPSFAKYACLAINVPQVGDVQEKKAHID